MKSCVILGLTILIMFAISLVFAFFFMLLWNWVVPAIFNDGPELTFWLAWGLTMLLSFIGSFFRTTVSK